MEMAGMIKAKGDNKVNAGDAPGAMSNTKTPCGVPKDTTPTGKGGGSMSSGAAKHARSSDKSENMKNMPKDAY